MKLPEEEQQRLKDWMYDLLYELYENERTVHRRIV